MRTLEVAEHRVAEHLVQSPASLHELEPGFEGLAGRFTSRVGSGTGSGWSRIWLNSEKIAAFAPMRNASDTMATW